MQEGQWVPCAYSPHNDIVSFAPTERGERRRSKNAVGETRPVASRQHTGHPGTTIHLRVKHVVSS